MALLDEDRCLQTMLPQSVHVNKQRYQARGVVCLRFAYDTILERAAAAKGEGADAEGAAAGAEGAVIEASKNASANAAGVVLGVGPRFKLRLAQALESSYIP
jgi:hypothetical protein